MNAKVLAIVVLGLSLSACDTGSNFQDLDSFMAEADRQPGIPVEPVPTFNAYEAFTYSAASRRAPFSPPAEIVLATEPKEEKSEIKPDENRPRELLENYAITSLNMVGTLRKSARGPLFALVVDETGGIHRVTRGQYMGKNHGRVIKVSEGDIQIVEIVPNGRNGWLERPRTMSLNDDNES